jgi:hypothetical protein
MVLFEFHTKLNLYMKLQIVLFEFHTKLSLCMKLDTSIKLQSHDIPLHEDFAVFQEINPTRRD